MNTTTTDGTPPRWYSVNNIGMATLCADKADAEDVARTCDIDFPRQSPHRAVQLVEASNLDTERTARQEAQQRLADMQELANSCLDKVAHDLIQEMKPSMREDVMAAYQAMVKAKAAKMMKALEKVEE